MEFQKVIAPRDKRKIFEAKVGEEIERPPKYARAVSANRKIIDTKKKQSKTP